MRGPGKAVVAAVGLLAAVHEPLQGADPSSETRASIQRGRSLFVAQCALCHQVTGQGTPGVYPPLAASDFIVAHRQEAIRGVVAGLTREITVKGRKYRGRMPAALLDDNQVADTLTFVLNSWGNPGGLVLTAEVQSVRAHTEFPTFAALSAANAFHPPPHPPEGFAVQEVARLPDFATRLAGDGRSSRVFVLGLSGVVWRLDLASRQFQQVLSRTNFPDLEPGDITALGMTLGPDGQLWMTINQRVDSSPLATNRVSIYRTTAQSGTGDPAEPKLWFRTQYPYGIGPYNHGVSDVKFGPDGLLYVSSGSRTDGGERGNGGNLGTMGETELTSCVWRLDPKAEVPKIEVIARGIRNAYSLNWDGSGRLFTVSNGPDAHAPEEMDFVTPPGPGAAPEHHGFPYQFGDDPPEKKWYPHTPAAPAGRSFVLPVLNVGPDGTLGGAPTSTFTPHSSPAGLVWLGPDWPEPLRNGFLMGRFGNLIDGVNGEDTGFDLLSIKLQRRPDGRWEARTHRVLAPLARPLDLYVVGKRILVLEYTRTTDFKSQVGMLPGRILELAVP